MSNPATSNRTQKRDEHQSIIRCLFEQVYSKGELSHVTDIVASDCIGYSTESSTTYLGPKGLKTHVSRLRGAFHGFTIDIDDLHVEDESFAVSWTARGTHERRFLGIDPTCHIGPAGAEPHGSRIAVDGVTTGTIKNCTIHEYRMVWNVANLRTQLRASDETADTGVPESTTPLSHSLER